jgi:hypothetical protein
MQSGIDMNDMTWRGPNAQDQLKQLGNIFVGSDLLIVHRNMARTQTQCSRSASGEYICWLQSPYSTPIYVQVEDHLSLVHAIPLNARKTKWNRKVQVE